MTPTGEGTWPGEELREPRVQDVGYLHNLTRTRLLKSYLRSKSSRKVSLNVLDVGCGEKPYYPLFAELANSYVGLDIQRTSHVDIVCNAENFPLIEDAFEIAFCSQVLEHVKNPRELLIEVRRVLKEEGEIILFVPSFWPLHLAPRDYRRWTRYGIAVELELTGFDDIDVHDCGGSFAGIIQMLLFAADGFFGAGNRLTRFSLRFIRSILNSIGLLLDRRVKNDAFTTNLFVTARKKRV